MFIRCHFFHHFTSHVRILQSELRCVDLFEMHLFRRINLIGFEFIYSHSFYNLYMLWARVNFKFVAVFFFQNECSIDSFMSCKHPNPQLFAVLGYDYPTEETR